MTVIDGDPNHPIKAWAAAQGSVKNLTVVADVDEDSVLDHVEAVANTTPFVVVDLEGTTAKMVLLAVSRPIWS